MAEKKKTRLTKITQNKHNQLRSQLDDFTTFQWDGLDSFENFGAFILNDKKGSLKFYNGPGFSNEYSKPQFESSAGELMGVSFNKQTISFSIGVYWISIENYRKLINWLNPLKVEYLIFNFEPNFRYNVKLSKIGDSTRWILGKENGEPRYYTELNLTFEIQGAQCAKGVESYEFGEWEKISADSDLEKGECILQTQINKEYYPFIRSDLPTPLDIPLTFALIGTENDVNKNIVYNIDLKAIYEKQEISLFNLKFQNLTHTIIKDNNEIPLKLHINYNSETGLIYLKYGDSTERLLTLLNTTDSGDKIISNYAVNKFLLPGRFDFPLFLCENMKLQLAIKKITNDGEALNLSQEFYSSLINDKSTIICYPRTNLI